MQQILRHSLEWSDWQAASAGRLNISMFLATVLVAAMLSVIRLPTIDFLAPVRELIISIVPAEDTAMEIASAEQAEPDTVKQAEERFPVVAPSPELAEAAESRADSPATELQQTPAAVAERSTAWESEKAKAVQDAVDDMERIISVNPNLDQRRKEAAIKFRPSEAPVKKEIWENVEKDVMGRTILRSGNCYRVLDDPGVVNKWTFETFDQFISYCTYRKYIGKNLPWVQDIYDRHAYLREKEARLNGDAPPLP